MATDPKLQPDRRSGDFAAMERPWRTVSDLLEGAEAVRAGGERYLPRFPAEEPEDYHYRCGTAPYTNILGDVIDGLAAAPFRREVGLKGDVGPAMTAFAEDVDLCGTGLHPWAGRWFHDAIACGVAFLLVDAPKLPPWAEQKMRTGRYTLADQKALNHRPGWVRIHPTNALAVETAVTGGREQFVHVRLRESVTRRDGFGETTVDRVRVLNREKLGDGKYAPAMFQVFERQADGRGAQEWALVDQGPFGVDGEIPLVALVLGRRRGGWLIDLPLQGCVDLQIEHYVAGADLQHIKTAICFPMLTVSGVERPSHLVAGPNKVLFAPEGGAWSFLEPSGRSFDFLAKDLDRIERQLRDLGRQPLVEQSNVTVIGAAFTANRANSLIAAWSLRLKDALEQALAYTARWMGEKAEPEVDICDDFDVALRDDGELAVLQSAREAGDLSRDTWWSELKRRGVLSPEFDAEAERQRLVDETPDRYGLEP